MDRLEETITEPTLLVRVPGPGVLEVGVDELVMLDTKTHASRLARRSANRCSKVGRRPWPRRHRTREEKGVAPDLGVVKTCAVTLV